ncbi:MAG TPA: glycosyl transferase, partial [Solirubrobacterales bacterium]|nr:glycosyl transferase [Solirubrobacterales bacterium]
MRFLVAAFGDPGHAFPAIALGRALSRRGHEVTIESWEERRAAVEGAGLGFTAAEEYRMFPPPDPDSIEGSHAAEAARALLPLLEETRPHAVVSDILTLAPTLAAEVAGVPLATLIPHIYPVVEPGLPFFAVGLRPPRTPLGRGVWRLGQRALDIGLEQGRRDLNRQRARLGLPPTERFHGGISQELALVATFPQLEYPRRWPAGVEVTGPMT